MNSRAERLLRLRPHQTGYWVNTESGNDTEVSEDGRIVKRIRVAAVSMEEEYAQLLSTLRLLIDAHRFLPLLPADVELTLH